MSHAALGPAVNKDGEALARPFVKWLLRLIRAQDFHGSCQRKSDTGLLATEELRRNIHSLAIRIRTRCGGLDMFLNLSGAGDRGALRRDVIVNNRNQTDRCFRTRAFHRRAVRRSVEASTGSASRPS